MDTERRRRGRAIRKRARVERAWIRDHIQPRDTEERERRLATRTARAWVVQRIEVHRG